MTELPAVDAVTDAYRNEPVALLAGTGELVEPLAAALRGRGWTVYIGATAPDGVRQLDLVVDCVEAAGPDAQATALRDSLLLAGSTQEVLERVARDKRAAFVTVTRLDGRLGLTGEASETRATLGGVPGLVKTLGIEAPTLFCRAIDFAPALAPEQCAELFLTELHDAEIGLTQVGLSADGTRRTVTLTPEPDSSLPGLPGAAEPTADDLLVVTGGARGVTAACAIGLARTYRTGLLLLGRTPLCDEPAWAAGLPADRLRAEAADEIKRGGGKPTPREVERMARELLGRREIRQTLAEIHQAGARAEYIAVDITDCAAVRAALAPRRDQITGVVHGAGVLADALIKDKKAGDIERVLRTKLTGLRNVIEALSDAALRHVLLFSSVAGFFGNRGQSDYAMANEALNRWACALRHRLPEARVTSVNWGAWAGGMVTPALEHMFAERGIQLIPLDEGVGYFVEQFSKERAADTVCVVGPDSPLSAREAFPLAQDGVVMHRRLAATAADPVITDHAIGGVPVLPATAAIGGMLNAVDRAVPGAEITAVRGFAVHKGVVFDDAQPSGLRLAVRPGGAGTPNTAGQVYDVTVHDDSGRPRYRAEVVRGARASLPPVSGLPDPGSGKPVAYYEDGTLFHGPSLRGITAVLDPGKRTVLAARLDAPRLAAGAWEVPGYSPVLSDLLLQAVLVWARIHRGEAVLPTAVGEVELVAELPAGGSFLLIVDQVAETAGGIRCTVTACTTDGRVLQRLRDVEAVPSAGLGAKFQSAAAARS
ncbi:SDR family NAD(P)-dependent oxidoreductase [Streptomyces sp. OM5714]|uniref:SDR family NAD(P)-dependent oxidoreductase n=1 Tax=Streptomyces sp. OM5714 TaxID=2602736 RepID=UPI001969D22E|nr:SDR family NAD(P)-dependent oxidoreductase [Streptomyces sp. OM5714]